MLQYLELHLAHHSKCYFLCILVPGYVEFRVFLTQLSEGSKKCSHVRRIAIGINGATTRNYMKPEQLAAIKAQRPDLLILSFGTNEGYDTEYRAERHIGQLQRFIAALRENCGDSVCILLTTPPGCLRKAADGGKVENKNNGIVAETIANFARENNLALWNLYDIVGGDENACKNWQRGNYFQGDGVHFKNTAYELQGRLLGQAIAKAAF